MINRALKIGIDKFNAHPKFAPHSKFRSRVLYDSIAIKQWWKLLEIPVNTNTAYGIIEAGSWRNGKRLIVTCKKDKIDKLLPHLTTLGYEIVVTERKTKNSTDICLKNFY